MAEVQTSMVEVPFESIIGSLNTQMKSEDTKRDDFFDRIDETVDTDTLLKPKEEEKIEDKIEDKPEPKEEEKKKEDEDKKKVETADNITDVIVSDTEPKDKDPYTSNEIDKIYRELVKSEVIIGYNDDKPVTSLTELQQLIEENRKLDRQKVINEELPQFIESLPDEIQAAVKYATEGGRDFKGLFRALSEVEEFKQVEIKEDDRKTQEEVAFKYLKATKYAKGNEQKIKEVIDEWVDNGSLFKRSKEFKVELDEMQEQLVSQKLQEQEQRAKADERRQQEMKQQVYESIKDGDLNGLKLDKKLQGQIFTGLTTRGWKSKQDGRELNMLEALVEYHTIHKPNYKLLGEALFLLSDPETYKKKVTSEVAQKRDAETVRKLKTEESRTKSSSEASEQSSGIKRKSTNSNFWK